MKSAKFALMFAFCALLLGCNKVEIDHPIAGHTYRHSIGTYYSEYWFLRDGSCEWNVRMEGGDAHRVEYNYAIDGKQVIVSSQIDGEVAERFIYDESNDVLINEDNDEFVRYL